MMIGSVAPVRVLIAKTGLDGHEVGARVVARGLADQGMEVVYTGLRRTPEQVVAAAIQEDVDVIGISILSGAHMSLLPRMRILMHEQGLDNVILIVGGIIPEEDLPALKTAGVDAVFHPGTAVSEIAAYIRKRLGRETPRRGPGPAKERT
jgi:methylmalonyl-CoA mutase C-terminal domain/subunit